MGSFRDTRNVLLESYSENIMDDTEFSLLYDLNTSHNPDFPYWNYSQFDLESISEAECKAEFRFYKNDIYMLADRLGLPETISCYNRSKLGNIEGLCIYLRRFAYPFRYGDMIPRFGRSVPELSMISNYVMKFLYSTFNSKLRDMNQNWLSPVHSVHEQGGALQNYWGFIDGTVRPLCRPGENQCLLYNGHKRVHSIKFQSVTMHCALLHASGLLQDLNQFSHDVNGNQLCIYGDPAYPLRTHLLAPYQGVQITADQEAFNKSMSSCHIAVEWIFKDILNYFKFLDFKKNLKIGLSAVGMMYSTCAFLHNVRACLWGCFLIGQPSG